MMIKADRRRALMLLEEALGNVRQTHDIIGHNIAEAEFCDAVLAVEDALETAVKVFRRTGTGGKDGGNG